MNVSLPDSLRQFADQRAAEAGYGSVSEYVRELIRRDREHAAELHLRRLLQAGLDSGLPELADESYFARKRGQVAERSA